MNENISVVSFPGLGIGEFELNRVAFTIFGRDVMWYGVIICIGIILAFLYFSYRAGKAGISFDDVLDYTIITVPVAVVFARLYYIVFSDSSYNTFYDIIAIWEGGLAIYGAVIGGAISVICISIVKKQSFFKLADMIVPAVMIGQILGRWGNFMNGEAFGEETAAFCRMGLNNRLTGYETIFVHPTFLYESLWNLIGFALINLVYKKKKFNGEAMLFYFGWYGFGRMFIEMLRTDSLYIGNTGIRVSSLVGLGCVVIVLPLFIVTRLLQIRLKQRCPHIIRDDYESLAVIYGMRQPRTMAASDSTSEIAFNTEEVDRIERERDEAAKPGEKLFDEKKDEPHGDDVKPVDIAGVATFENTDNGEIPGMYMEFDPKAQTLEYTPLKNQNSDSSEADKKEDGVETENTDETKGENDG